MSRTTINSQTGAISYRTTLLSLHQAGAFAKCLQANVSRFTDVEITPSARAKGEKFFVTFRPVNPERQGALYENAFNARKDRANAEGLDYIFWADPDFPGSHWCFNPASGETYQVETFSCSCPDYQYRCKNAALLCKHQQALTLQRESGTIGKTDKVTPGRDTSPDARSARAARCTASLNRDF